MRPIAVFLLFLIAFPTLSGRELILALRRYHLHEAAERKIRQNPEEQSLEVFVFSMNGSDPSAPTWKREDEFSYGGKMYDVVRAEPVHSDSVRYFCLSDENEDRLVAQELRLSQQDRQNLPHRRKRVNPSLNPYCFNDNRPGIHLFATYLREHIAPEAQNPSGYLTPPDPPPPKYSHRPTRS